MLNVVDDWEDGVRNKKNQGLKPIDEPIYGYWQALYMCFYSVRLYIDVIKRWHGAGLTYLLFLLMLAGVPLTLRFAHQYVHYFMDELIFPIEKMPLLVIQNGKASIDEPVPYFVKSKSGKEVIEINTQVSEMKFPKNKPNLTILVTQEKFYFRPMFGQMFSELADLQQKVNISSYSFKSNDNEVFDGQNWVKTSGIMKWKTLGVFMLYPMIIGTLFGLLLVTNFIIASIGRIIAITLIKHRIWFIQSLRLSWVAQTPAFMVVLIALSFGFTLPYLSVFFMIMTFFYFCFGVLCDKRYSKQLVRV